MNWRFLLDCMIFMLFTLLFFADYFPTSLVAVTIPQGILLLLLLFALIGKSYLDKHAYSIKYQIGALLYVIVLMSGLTLLGGESQIGFAFNGSFFWIATVLALLNICKEWKEIRAEKLEAAS